MYEVLKSIHVLGAVAWVGAGIFAQVLALRARAAGPEPLMRFSNEMAYLGPRYFAPISGVVLLAGIGMVIVSGWNFTDLWIVLGLAGFAATFVTGMFFIGPVSERVAAGMAERGADDPGVQKDIARIFQITRIDAAVLVLIVIIMVVKPTL